MNEILIANLTLDTTKRNNIAPLIVPQGDYGARVIRSKITDLGKPVIVESTAAVSIVATRSGDGESQAFSGSVNADGTVTVPVTQWMLDVPEEDVTCHIVVTGIGYQYSTTSFLIEPQAKATPTEIAPDDPRQDLVTEVLAGENTRRAAEAERVSNENARIAAENARQSAEEQRLTDESTRITNEAQRVSAEASRDATFKSWAQDIASLPTFDGRISAIRKRIENLESGIPAESFIIDDSVAYTKDVPENVAPNAVVQKLGGMTYKSKNLFALPYDTASATINGVTFTINEDGSITATGTATADANFVPVRARSIEAGEYYFDCFTSGASDSTFMVYCETATSDGTFDKYLANKGVLTVAENRFIYVSFRVFSGYTVNTTIYPMLNEGDPKPYEPYFEGLRSAKVTEVKSVGANLFDFETWKATAATERAAVTYGDNSVTVSAIEGDAFIISEAAGVMVKGGETYTISFVESNTAIESVHYLFKNGKIDNSMKVFYGSPYTFVADADAEYYTVRFGVSNAGSTITFSNIKINKDSTARPYTPYVEHTLPIPEAVRPANGINENVYDFIEWAKDGSVKKTVKCGVVDLGALDWIYITDKYGNHFQAEFSGGKMEGKVLCAKYKRTTAWTINNTNIDKAVGIEAKYISIRDTSYTDTVTFKSALSGVMLVYELAEPIVTDISDLITADNLVPVQSGGTMTPVNEYSYAVPSTIIYQSL